MIKRIKKFIAILKLKRDIKKYYKNMTPKEKQEDSEWAEFATKQLEKILDENEK